MLIVDYNANTRICKSIFEERNRKVTYVYEI